MRRSLDLRATARHEAAHAVVRVLLKVGPFHRVVLLREPAEGRFGYLEPRAGAAERRLREPLPEPEPMTPEVAALVSDPANTRVIDKLLTVEAVFAYSGVAAQDRRSCGAWWHGEILSSSEGDRESLARVFAFWGRALDPRSMDARALRSARRLVDGVWSWVEAVADALLERLGESNAEAALTEPEVRATIAATPRARNPWRDSERLDRIASARLADQMCREESARGRNERGRSLDPALDSGGHFSPAAPAPLSLPGERDGARRLDIRRTSGAMPHRQALAGLPLLEDTPC